MSYNNYPDPTKTQPPADQQIPWNSPSQPSGSGYYYPPTTYTGYNAKFPLPPTDPQAPLPAVPPDEAYRLAERRVNARLRFYKHLASYLIVNAFLWAIAFVGWVSSGFGSVWALIWPIWVTAFWGIGLVSDYVQTFSLNETTRQRMIEEEMRRMRH
jgi:hypothetical protein